MITVDKKFTGLHVYVTNATDGYRLFVFDRKGDLLYDTAVCHSLSFGSPSYQVLGYVFDDYYLCLNNPRNMIFNYSGSKMVYSKYPVICEFDCNGWAGY